MTWAAEARERAAWDRCWHLIAPHVEDMPPLTEFNPYRRERAVVVEASEGESAEGWAMIRVGMRQVANGG